MSKSLKIILTGGGSGGHITPLLAVAHEIKLLRPDAQLIYIGQTGDKLADVPEQDKNIDQVLSVRAGKFRRYHGEGLKQLLDIKTLLKNIRDLVWVVVGIWQSWQLLGRLQPDVIFVKGGFVGVPVGLAAAARHIPYVTHDSDALPGLANRLIGRWAKAHAVALPKEVYKYKPEKTHQVGVPIARHFRVFSQKEVEDTKDRLNLGAAQQVLLITGGGNGSQTINAAVADSLPELLERYPGLWVVHIAGLSLEAGLRQDYKRNLPLELQSRVMVKGHVTNFYDYSGVSDVVVARAGATNIAEFAAQAKACVIVPSPFLAGGHQLKNARVLAERKAVKLVDEDRLKADHGALLPPLTDLLDHPDQARALGAKLATLAQPEAAKSLAKLLLDIALE